MATPTRTLSSVPLPRWCLFAALLAVSCTRTEPPADAGAEPSLSASAPPREAMVPASAQTMAALGGLGPGSVVGKFTVASVSEPMQGAIVIRTTNDAVFEVRLAPGGDVRAPASAGDHAVYYVNPVRRTEVTVEELVAGAQAIAASIDRAAPDASLPATLTPIPRSPGTAL